MIRHWQLKLVEWGRFGRIEDADGTFDDWRRRIQQETKTLRRMERNRLAAPAAAGGGMKPLRVPCVDCGEPLAAYDHSAALCLTDAAKPLTCACQALGTDHRVCPDY